jgi:hypothetical protein
MKRQVPGLAETARDSRPELPVSIFLVRVDGAQFRWHAHKPFYVPPTLCSRAPGLWPGNPSWVVTFARKKRCGSWAGSCGTSSMTQSFWAHEQVDEKALISKMPLTVVWLILTTPRSPGLI